MLGIIGGSIGLSVGLVTGVLVAEFGASYGIDKSLLYVVSFLSTGSLIFFFILPMEQHYFWRKVKNGIATKDGGLFDFAPVSFFLIVGIAIGVRHGCTQFVIC
jgi:hypothetical protein